MAEHKDKRRKRYYLDNNAEKIKEHAAKRREKYRKAIGRSSVSPNRRKPEFYILLI